MNLRLQRAAFLWLILICGSFAWSQGLPFASQSPSQPMLPMLKDGSPAAFVRFMRPKINNGLALINTGGPEAASDVFQGFLGVFPGPGSEDGNLYFQAAPDQLATATGTFFVTIQYFDQGQGAVEMSYLSHVDEKTREPRSERLYLGNSRLWAQHTFLMSGAVLDQSFEGGSDFAIHCPNTPLRYVALTRSPVGKPEQVVSPMFTQPRVVLPEGFVFALYPDEAPDSEFWYEQSGAGQKSQLYQSWGTRNVIDTLEGRMMQNQQGRLDLRPYQERAEGLAAQNLTWVPRIEIGNVKRIPPSLQQGLQLAVGLERNSPGPMLSLWDPNLIRIYREIFTGLRQATVNSQTPQIVLAFGGFWGPLMHTEANAWPDLWAGDPLALQAFQTHIRQRYANVNNVSRMWGVPLPSWNALSPKIMPQEFAQKSFDVYSWYQEAFQNAIAQIAQAARLAFPQAVIVLEIGDNYQYGAVDPRAVAQIAAQNNAAVLVASRNSSPTSSFIWQLFSYHCRQANVPFGLRFSQGSGPESVLSALYSLVSDGGTLFFYDEGQMASDRVWEQYLETVRNLRVTRPSRSVAVVFPHTSANAMTPVEWDRLSQEMRELFAFDMVDEYDLETVTSARYPIVLSPWGHLWSPAAIQNFERLARSGSAVVVQTDQPWQTLNGDRTVNELLFAARLVRQGQQWVLAPRSGDADLVGDNDRSVTARRRVISMDGAGDVPFLAGEWSPSQTQREAKQYGFEFGAFRWMGERGAVQIPIAPSTNYNLIVEGFVPKGQTVAVTVNGRPFGQIQGQGMTLWSRQLEVRNQNVEVQMTGRTWSAGEIFGATQTFRPSMAVSRIAILPRGEELQNVRQTPSGQQALQQEFQRQTLRGSWLRETGQGVTLIAPTQYVNQFVFMELMNSIVQNPRVLDPRFALSQPPDGAVNNVYVSPLSDVNAYLNLTPQPVILQTGGRRPRNYTIPPMQISYFN